MKLRRLWLVNWRSFHGTAPIIRFADSPDRNVTVFHACNGAGKTNLLNAFLWLFYKQTSPRFQHPDQLINKRAILEAIPGEEVQARVELEFIHDDRCHRAVRSATVERTDESRKYWTNLQVSDLQIQYDDGTGEWITESAAEDLIQTYLPPEIRDFFFFDGEDLGSRFRHDVAQQKRLAAQMRRFFGLELTERARQHLAGAEKMLAAELKRHVGEEDKALIERRNKLEQECDDDQEHIEELERNILGYKEKLETINAELHKMESAQKAQKERERLEFRREENLSQLSSIRREVCNQFSREGYVVFLGKPLLFFDDEVASLRKRGELPSGIKRDFVERLLSDEICICRRGLSGKADPEHRHAVEEWLSKGGLSDVEERVVRMQGHYSEIQRRSDAFWEELELRQDQSRKLRISTREIEKRLGKISAELEECGYEDVEALEKARNETGELLDEARHEHGRTEEQIRAKKVEIERLSAILAKIENREAEAKRAQTRLVKCNDARKCVDELHDALDGDWRSRLVSKIGERFRQISTTVYEPDLNADYRLQLVDRSGGLETTVPASGGEGQVLALCFVGGIIELQKERRRHSEEILGADATSYPIVMDSPYGALAGNYRRQVSQYLPNVADQIVALVTDTQWEGENARVLGPKLGRSYVMIYHTPRPDLVEDDQASIQLHGRNYELVTKSVNEFEWTEIVEVANA